MREQLQIYCDRLYDNYITLEKAYTFELTLTRSFVSLEYACSGRHLDIPRLKTIERMINQLTSWFSPYRGNYRLLFGTLLDVHYPEPDYAFKKLLEHHKILKSCGFKETMYFPVTNYALLACLPLDAPEEQVRALALKAKSVYEEMRRNHPWLTSSDDYPLAMLIAAQDGSIHKVEEIYTELNRRGFTKSNGLQLLSHILSFSPDTVLELVERCEMIAERMKQAKLTIYPQYYAGLGVITILQSANNTLLEDWIDVSMALTTMKRLKWLGKGSNVILASSIVASELIQTMKDTKQTSRLLQTAMTIHIEALIAAQTAATIATITASTAAASSSN